eukprot:1509493-Pleurochrysis_carterae.AAC.1
MVSQKAGREGYKQVDRRRSSRRCREPAAPCRRKLSPSIMRGRDGGKKIAALQPYRGYTCMDIYLSMDIHPATIGPRGCCYEMSLARKHFSRAHSEILRCGPTFALQRWPIATASASERLVFLPNECSARCLAEILFFAGDPGTAERIG